MINQNDVVATLGKCSAYDPAHFPKPSKAMVEAWVEHFSDYVALTRDDLLGAVKTYYRQPGRDVPLPGDISSLARGQEPGDAELTARHEELCNSKALDHEPTEAGPKMSLAEWERRHGERFPVPAVGKSVPRAD